jgi:hypothetical protein
LSQFPVIGLLTDLNHYWEFYWLQPGKLVRRKCDLQEGKNLLKQIISELDSPALKDDEQVHYRNRCRLQDLKDPSTP